MVTMGGRKRKRNSKYADSDDDKVAPVQEPKEEVDDTPCKFCGKRYNDDPAASTWLGCEQCDDWVCARNRVNVAVVKHSVYVVLQVPQSASEDARSRGLFLHLSQLLPSRIGFEETILQ